MADADKMLEWKNYPETIQFSIATKWVITKANHLNWLKRNVQYFQVIEEGTELCGAIRIKDHEISIWIDRKHRCKGVASFFLNQTVKKGMTAKIVNGNISSIRAFINAGFKPIAYQDNYYTFYK